MMLNYIDETQQITITTSQLDYEILSTYLEYDPNNYMSLLDEYTILVTDMPRSSTSYYRKENAIGTNDFELNFDFQVTKLDPPATGTVGAMMCIMLVNRADTTDLQKSSTNQDGLRVQVRSYSADGINLQYLLRMESLSSGTTVYDETLIELNTQYNINMKRVSSTVTWIVKKDTTVIKQASRADTTNIQYFIPMCGRASTGTLFASGIAKNFYFS